MKPADELPALGEILGWIESQADINKVTDSEKTVTRMRRSRDADFIAK
jgi:hypothetical protein